jgi:tetratricopeptide (TPR) repeat protein
MWRQLSIVILPAIALAWAHCKPAQAQTASYEQAKQWCFQDGVGSNKIAGCSTVIVARREAPANIAAAYVNRGSAYSDMGNDDRAIEDFDQALRMVPGLAPAFLNRGNAYAHMGDTARALKDYDQAIRLDPNYARAYYNRGAVYDDKGDRVRAIKDYSQAIRLKPDYINALNNRGLAYHAQGDYDRAIKDFSEIIRIKPDEALAFNNRAADFSNRGSATGNKADYDSAVADLNEAIRLQPDYAEAFTNRGIVYSLKGDFDQAIRDYDQAVRLRPDLTLALDNRRLAVMARDRVAAMLQVKKLSSAATGQSEVAAGSAIASERRVALVIGNSVYRAYAPLPNPDHDAELVGAALQQTGIDVTIAHDLDRSGMVEALKTFAAKADDADWAIIYYAGHGMELNGTNYLVPVDARLQNDRDVPDETISLQSLLSAIEGARKLRLVVLDACRNNPFVQNMKVADASRAISRGLARIEPTNATLVVYAAKEGTIAADGGGENSPFALAFVKRISQSGVEIGKVMRFVRQDVLEATGNRQEPFLYGSLPPDDFFFKPGG